MTMLVSNFLNSYPVFKQRTTTADRGGKKEQQKSEAHDYQLSQTHTNTQISLSVVERGETLSRWMVFDLLVGLG